jgi:hypothetical protein
MGLLDDAIKDHLELKRRHGGDPGEIARLEHEALGPARREPLPGGAPEEPLHASAPVSDAPPLDDEYDDEVPAEERLEAPVHYAEPMPEPPAPEPAAPEPEPEPEPEAAAPPEEPIVEQQTRQFSLEELEDASTPPPAAPAKPTEPHHDEPPPERRREDVPHADVVPADEEPEGDDVLEETPEFLQETPEHDRLWFEQKPPKDFDF